MMKSPGAARVASLASSWPGLSDVSLKAANIKGRKRQAGSGDMKNDNRFSFKRRK